MQHMTIECTTETVKIRQTLSFTFTKLGQEVTFPSRVLISLTLILKVYSPLSQTFSVMQVILSENKKEEIGRHWTGEVKVG